MVEIVREDGVARFPVGVPFLSAGIFAFGGRDKRAAAWAPDEHGNGLGYRVIRPAKVRLGLGGPAWTCWYPAVSSSAGKKFFRAHCYRCQLI